MTSVGVGAKRAGQDPSGTKRKNRGTCRGGCPYIWIDGEGYDKSIWALLGAAKEAEDDTGGGPIVVLVNIGAEGSPVVVEIEHADFPVTGGVDIQAAAHFIRQTVRRSGVTADSGNGGVRAGAADEGFDKRRDTPGTMLTVEITRAEMISIEDSFGAVDGYEVVAAVADDLQPWLEIPAEGPHGAV